MRHWLSQLGKAAEVRPLSDPPDAETLRDPWEPDLTIEGMAETVTGVVPRRNKAQHTSQMQEAAIPIIETPPERTRL